MQAEGAPITTMYTQEFTSPQWHDDFLATTNNYHVAQDALSARGAFNHPLWLRRKLPRNVRIEFDCWSMSADGDIKVEFFGDGKSHAPSKEKVQYKATGYIAVFGGWNNTRSILAKRDEHGRVGVTLQERRAPKVVKGKHYHWKITRKGKVIHWYIDNMKTPFLTLRDNTPLEGKTHAYFAFNNWQSDTWFDNVKISPLHE